MDNTFDTHYLDIVNEAFVLPRKIYAPVMDYYIDAYRKFHTKGLKRTTDKSFPTVTIPLDVSGTQYDMFAKFNPEIRVELTSEDEAYYNEGGNRIVLGFARPIREVIDVVEHELLHYFQKLYSDHIEHKYRYNKKLMPNQTNWYGGKTSYGGLSKKEFQQDDTDVHGNAKSFYFTVQGGLKIFKASKNPYPPDFTIRAKDERDALKKLSYLFFKRKGEFVYSRDHRPLTDYHFKNKLITASPERKLRAKRTLHTYRPIEYWTDLISNLRHLQTAYMDTLSRYYTDELDIRRAMESEVKKKSFFDMKLRNKELFHFGTDIHPEWKNSYLKLLYKMFVSDNTPFENYDYIQKIREIKKLPVEPKKAKVTTGEMNQFMNDMRNFFDIVPESFDDRLVVISSDDRSDLSNLDDDNYAFVEDMFTSLDIKERENKVGGWYFYGIKRSPSTIKKLFRNIEKKIAYSRIGWKSDPDKYSVIGRDGKKYPEYYNIVYFAHELLEQLRKDSWATNREFTKAPLIPLLQYLIRMNIPREILDFIKLDGD